MVIFHHFFFYLLADTLYKEKFALFHHLVTMR